MPIKNIGRRASDDELVSELVAGMAALRTDNWVRRQLLEQRQPPTNDQQQERLKLEVAAAIGALKDFCAEYVEPDGPELPSIFKCDRCRAYFPEDDAVTKRETEMLSGRRLAFREFTCCPYCNAPDIGPVLPF